MIRKIKCCNHAKFVNLLLARLRLSPSLDQSSLHLVHESAFDNNNNKSAKKKKKLIETIHLTEFKISLQADEVPQMKSK